VQFFLPSFFVAHDHQSNLGRVERTGTPYWILCKKLQQFDTKEYQAERSRCDKKTVFERLYLVLGLSTFEFRINCPYVLTPPPLRLFLDFCAIFFECGPSFIVSTRFPPSKIWPSSGLPVPSQSPGEGTGTRPDYLVNRVLTKNEGPDLKKIYADREIVVK